uniref:Uncharacterized protein n=2 Tax=Candidatus Kentrum eta TaxID=2126337 RepID=A0A450VHF4_9GAMM|nr:MAG: hypothetical protein BECKH772C_GA0070978_101655 [Candidatus Kentron sp. H]
MAAVRLQKEPAMVSQDTCRVVVQHAMNITGLMQQIEEEIQTILEVLGIETEFVLFDDGFPDPSITE